MNEHDLYQAIGNLSDELLQQSEQGVKEQMKQKSNKKPVSFRRGVRVALVAAAVLSIGTVTVFAVGNFISMMDGKIDFFQNAPEQSSVSDPISTFRGNYNETMQKLETFNAPVGQSVTDNGVTITLDSVSMDISGVDLFFTLTGEDAIQQTLAGKDYYPAWSTMFEKGPTFYDIAINGEQICQKDAMDWYMAEDGSMKIWAHYLFTQVPQGDEILLQVAENDMALGKQGSWKFSVSVDGASIRSGGRQVQAGQYPMVGVPLQLDDSATSQMLDVKNIAFGAKGGVFSASYSNFIAQDDTGKELYFSHDSVFNTESDVVNLTSPDSAAKSITLTPVALNPNGENGENKTITTEQMKQGIKFNTNDCGGYTVQNYQVKDHAITFELVPFGWNPNYFELIPNDTDKISLVERNEGKHSALQSRVVNPQTGVISMRYDYYAASQQELESISEWQFYYFSTQLLTDSAVTLELNNIS